MTLDYAKQIKNKVVAASIVIQCEISAMVLYWLFAMTRETLKAWILVAPFLFVLTAKYYWWQTAAMLKKLSIV